MTQDRTLELIQKLQSEGGYSDPIKLRKGSPDQERDENGRFAGGGADSRDAHQKEGDRLKEKALAYNERIAQADKDKDRVTARRLRSEQAQTLFMAQINYANSRSNRS